MSHLSDNAAEPPQAEDAVWTLVDTMAELAATLLGTVALLAGIVGAVSLFG